MGSPTLYPLCASITDDHTLFLSQLNKPSLNLDGKPLFWQGNTSMAKATHPNLEKTLGELLKSGDQLTVTDSNLPVQLVIHLTLT